MIELESTFLAEAPALYEPAAGGWGRMGMTLVKLDAPEDVIADALKVAYRNVEQKAAGRKRQPSRRGPSA